MSGPGNELAWSSHVITAGVAPHNIRRYIWLHEMRLEGSCGGTSSWPHELKSPPLVR